MSARRGLAGRVRSRGFSLVEVLIALIVLSVGLLGIAKMEALALSSTSVASRRALAAVEAASLADSMHANRGYWGTAANVAITITGTTISNGPGAAGADCSSGGANAPCSAANLASYDLQAWGNALSALLPGDQATVTCNTLTPLECAIQIQWSEQAIGMNNAQTQSTSTAAGETAGTSAAIQNTTYTLYVEP
jgi:type IV pilus assembly protein PilV